MLAWMRPWARAVRVLLLNKCMIKANHGARTARSPRPLGSANRAPAMTMTEDIDLIDYLLLLRFGTSHNCTDAAPVLNYSAIAKIVKKPLGTVRRLILFGVRSQREHRLIQPRCRTKLKDHHIDFICSQSTLRDWAHLSLRQRAVMFHRTFPELKISATLLKRTYKQHGIRFKFILRGKKIIDYGN